MVSVTISVPDDVRKLMKQFPEVNWSGLVRACITEKAKRLEMKQKLLGELEKEKDFNNWAVGVVREGRKRK